MFEKLKDKLFTYIQRRHPAKDTAFPDYENVRSVLILFESDPLEKNTAILELRDRLLQEDKDVVLWGFAPKKEIASLILPQRRILGLGDQTFWGGLREDVISDLQGRRYDLMIDLTQQPCLPLRYAALYARADFKAGLPHTQGISHFILNTPPQENGVFLFNQIIHYLKCIRSNDKA